MLLNFTGDIMLGRGIGDQIKKSGQEYIFRKIINHLPLADGTIANLEAPFTFKGVPNKKKDAHLTFKINPDYISALSYLKISSVTLANNHITDYGKEGIKSTTNTLEASNITYTGAGENRVDALKPICYFDQENKASYGIFAFNAFVPFTKSASRKNFGSAKFDRTSVEFAIKKYGNDFNGIILTIHWGIDYESYPIPQLISFIKKIIDDYPKVIAIIGHHPHIIQPILNYKGVPIFCSLGNFLFDEPFPQSRIGCIASLDLQDGGIKNYTVIYTKLEAAQTLTLLSDEETLALERRLEFIKESIEKKDRKFLAVDKKWIKYLTFQAVRYGSINDLTYLLSLYSPFKIIKSFINND